MSDQATAPVVIATGTAYAGTPAPDSGTPAPVAAAPATPAAPVAPAAPAAAPAAPAIPEPSGDGKLEMTGDPGLDTALEFVNNAGIKANDPAIEAARNGDFTLLEAKLAVMGDKAKGYERMVALAKQAFERHSAQVEQTSEKVAKMAYEHCGGEAGWAAVSAWAGANATPEEKAQINDALAKGGVSARGALQYLAEAYKRAGSPGYREPAGAVKADAGANAAAGAAPLTAKAYAQEVQKLLATSKGRDITVTPAYRELQARRIQARNAGY